MALVTAKQYGIHPDIIVRAEEIKKEIQYQSKKAASILIDSSSGFISSTIGSSIIGDSSDDNTTIVGGSSSSSSNSSSSSGRNITRYDLRSDILPVIRSFIPEFNPVVVEVNYKPPVSFEGHNCVYVLLLSNTDNEV